MGVREVTLGIDIGGTNTKYGLVDKEGHCHLKAQLETRAERPFEDFLQRLLQDFRSKYESLQARCRLVGVGIGAPNANYYTGTLENPPNLSWKFVRVAELVRPHLDLPLAVTNDANAAALGEMMYGKARGMQNFIALTLGTGLGSGVVVNGEVVYGHDGFAGEMGHLTVMQNGRLCGCGRYGCLETIASATGLVRTVRELLASRSHLSRLRTLPEQQITSKEIAAAAQEKDPLALEAFEYTGSVLGRALADVVALLSPRAIFLGGGLALSGELIREPTKRNLEAHLMPIFRNKVDILLSGLPAGEAAILGAGALIWHELELKGSV